MNKTILILFSLLMFSGCTIGELDINENENRNGETVNEGSK
jgi:hypothetical protein